MSVLNCIARLHSEGKIDARQKREAEDYYNGIVKRLYPHMPAASAEARAAVETAKILEESAKQRRYALAKNAIGAQRGLERIQQHENGPIAGFMGIFSRDIRGQGGENAESLAKDYKGRMAAAMEAIIAKYGVKAAGLKQDVAGIRAMIHETFGDETGNAAAKQLAEGWKGLDEFATGEGKRLGKVFTPAEDWRVPQRWESGRARKFGTKALIADWRQEMRHGLKVFDPETHAEATAIRLEEILPAAAEKIAKDLPFEGGLSSAFTNDMRIFRFAEGKEGAESYLRLMDKYGIGRGGYLQAMQAHVERISNELAMMKLLGPDWRTTGEGLYRKALDLNRSGKYGDPSSWPDYLKSPGKVAVSPIESEAAAAALWKSMSGQSSQVGSEMFASIMAGARAFATSRKLGSAIVTAIPTDSVNWLMAAKHLGMDQGRLVARVTESFLHDSPQNVADAARLGINSHVGPEVAIATKRFSDQLFGEQVMQRLASTVVRAQGLHHWDMAIRRSFLTEFLSTVASRAGKNWDELDAPFRDHFLVPYRFTEKEWGTLADPANHVKLGEASYLDPDAISGKNEPLRQKVMSALYDESQFAYVVGGSARVRAISHAGQAGTLPGELARNIFLFKNFPMTFLSTWGMRAATTSGGLAKAVAIGQLMTYTTMAGALTMQAKAILQGKDPQNMLDPWFWLQAAFTGGSLGIYGDFIRDAISRSDNTLLETLAGPLASDITNVEGLLSRGRRQLEGENVTYGAHLARVFKDFSPGNNLWYTRLMSQRLVFDQIQKMIDPAYYDHFARQRERSMKLTGQDQWWLPGETAPSRPPDIGAALGGQ